MSLVAVMETNKGTIRLDLYPEQTPVTVANFVNSWEVQRDVVRRGPKQDLALPGGCQLRNCRHSRGLLGGPAEWRSTRIQRGPRGSLGGCELRNCRHFRGLLGGPAE